MALARLALKNFGQRVVSPSCSSLVVSQSYAERSLGTTAQKQRWGSEFMRRLSTKAGDHDEKSERREVAVTDKSDKKFKLFPRKQRKRSLWKNRRDFVPSLYEFFPSGLENALMQATENVNRLFEKLSPSRLMGRVKENDECYKLRFDLPGLSKDDVKIRVENGILVIKGEHKEELEEHEDEEYYWSYGYYNTSVVLPEDAKVDEIKAEMKDGVLTITIPRTETPEKDVKEISIE